MSVHSQGENYGDEQQEKKLEEEKPDREDEHQRLYMQSVNELQAILRDTEARDPAQALKYLAAIRGSFKLKSVSISDLEHESIADLKAGKIAELVSGSNAGRDTESTFDTTSLETYKSALDANSGEIHKPTCDSNSRDIYASVRLSEEEEAKAMADAKTQLTLLQKEVAEANRTLDTNPACAGLVKGLYKLVTTSKKREFYILKSFSKINELSRDIASGKTRRRSRMKGKRRQTGGSTVASSAEKNPTCPSAVSRMEENESRAQLTPSASFTKTCGIGHPSVQGPRTETAGPDTLNSYSRTTSPGPLETAPM